MSTQRQPATTATEVPVWADLRGRRALVTGGGVGIGQGIVIALARAGANVSFTHWGHDATEVLRRLRLLGLTGTAHRLDVTDSSEVDRVFALAADDLGGGIDILVNNAGGLVGRVPVSGMDDVHWHKVLNLNLSSAFYCSRAVLRHMGADSGRIVNISSVAGESGGGPGAAAYAASKAGLDGLTRGLAKELGGRGITVNSIAPGMILDTPFHQNFSTQQGIEAAIAASPLRIAGYPDDVAAAVLYLASDHARFVTGAVIDVNGGTWF
jgi:3-oxoacyl-[acyl-carrier protein] reductase